MEYRVQLAVEYADHQTRYYPVNRGWRIDAASRCIVIGTDLPRIYVPLDGVFAFTVEQVEPAAATCSTCGHKPPEGLLDTPWGPVCNDGALCQIRRAGRPRRVRVDQAEGGCERCAAQLICPIHDDPRRSEG